VAVCKWHRCGKEFEPQHHLQHFCSTACQKARGRWKEQRGGPIVEALLAGDMAEVEALKVKLQEEIAHGV